MEPRIFISSTYYDLKHVRERLEKFLKTYKFIPVLFESDNVVFEHNKKMDTSCYNEVRNCQMMILIIGGRYGSEISGKDIIEKKKQYIDEYISITKKEYETAVEMNIPIYIFIDKYAYTEYKNYRNNFSFFEKKNEKLLRKDFIFVHTDDINVFRFIHILNEKAIKTFENVAEIENYLSYQFAGIFNSYIKMYQDQKRNEKVLDTVNELNNVIQRMNEMVQEVGKNVIQNENDYEKVINKQANILIDFFSDVFDRNIEFEYINNISNDKIEKIFSSLEDTIFNNVFISTWEQTGDIYEEYELFNKTVKNLERALLI